MFVCFQLYKNIHLVFRFETRYNIIKWQQFKVILMFWKFSGILGPASVTLQFEFETNRQNSKHKHRLKLNELSKSNLSNSIVNVPFGSRRSIPRCSGIIDHHGDWSSGSWLFLQFQWIQKRSRCIGKNTRRWDRDALRDLSCCECWDWDWRENAVELKLEILSLSKLISGSMEVQISNFVTQNHRRFRVVIITQEVVRVWWTSPICKNRHKTEFSSKYF